MARSRNIKPSIMDNEHLAEFEPLSRLLFIYMWMLADREGRLEDRPKRIAAMALPYDRSADVDQMLDDLQSAGFLVRYQVGSSRYIQITSFTKHQSPHIKESASVIPAQGATTTAHGTSTNLGSDKHQTSTNLGSVEQSPRSPDSLIPDSLIPDCGERTEDSSGNPPQTGEPTPVSNAALPTMAGAVCTVLRAEGIGSVSPSHPRLASLLNQSAEVGLFSDAARIAKANGKATFAYVLGVVEGMLNDAKTLAAQPRASPDTYETPYQRSMRKTAEEFAPGIARKAPGQSVKTFENAGVSNVIAIRSR